MVYCPTCENACSEAAPSCPRCGHPLIEIAPIHRVAQAVDVVHQQQVTSAAPIYIQAQQQPRRILPYVLCFGAGFALCIAWGIYLAGNNNTVTATANQPPVQTQAQKDEFALGRVNLFCGNYFNQIVTRRGWGNADAMVLEQIATLVSLRDKQGMTRAQYLSLNTLCENHKQVWTTGALLNECDDCTNALADFIFGPPIAIQVAAARPKQRSSANPCGGVMAGVQKNITDVMKSYQSNFVPKQSAVDKTLSMMGNNYDSKDGSYDIRECVNHIAAKVYQD